MIPHLSFPVRCAVESWEDIPCRGVESLPSNLMPVSFLHPTQRSITHLVVLHNFTTTELLNELIFDQNSFLSFQNQPLSENSNLIATILGGFFESPSRKVQSQQKKKKGADISTKKQERRDLAHFRQKILESTQIKCSNCENSSSFRTVRHIKGKREFRIVPVSTDSSYVSRIDTLLNEINQLIISSKCKLLTLCGNSKINEILTDKLHTMHPELSLRSRDLESAIIDSSRVQETAAHRRTKALQEFNDYCNTYDTEMDESDIFEQIFQQVVSWLHKRSKSHLAKDKWKFQKQILPLLKYKPSEQMKKQTAVKLVPQFDPRYCDHCSAFCIVKLMKRNQNRSLTSVFNNTLQPLNSEEKEIYELVLATLQNQTSLPNSISALCHAVESCCNSSLSIDFDRMFRRLEQEGLVKIQNYDELEFDGDRIAQTVSQFSQ